MQIKNTILSLAAAVALVQAAPSPAVGTPVTPAVGTTVSGTTHNIFDTCFTKGTAMPNLAHLGVDQLTVAKNCGDCLDKAVAECPKIVCGDGKPVGQGDCYNTSVEACMSKLGYFGQLPAASDIPVPTPVALVPTPKE